MCLMNERGFLGCGTIRKNRMLNVNLKSGKELPRGNHDYRFDTTNEILMARWNDNADVKMITNFETIEPLKTTRRYDRKQKRIAAFHQPHLINSYNQHMGGVDLHDNAAASYRVNVRGKKFNSNSVPK
ncbi:piggyBac transposable element-derived protein 2-like [Sitodiplosis mosellana]|uniref:piggyBac transposable element-derived protein 2-like n=1 Tax=Sitodiplosis mosellana TaxID=263140 RepID=UPI002443EF9D|nr:piggyBac transposable element-derived protein 2-like [Sitodiplosis mosellana]